MQNGDSAQADTSRGYDALASEFARRRDPVIGVGQVRNWAHDLPRGAAVLDLGCGHGVPISQALIDDGFEVHAIDASPVMVAMYRERFPTTTVACEPVEESSFFGRTFDAAIAWGLLFLLERDIQVKLIHSVAAALAPGGRFLFTAPEQECSWTDVLTGRPSISLGAEAYLAALEAAGMTLVAEADDDAGNHYYQARRKR